MKPDYSLIPYTKLNSRWIKALNIKPETVKLLEEKTGSKSLTSVLVIFLCKSPQAREIKVKIN